MLQSDWGNACSAPSHPKALCHMACAAALLCRCTVSVWRGLMYASDYTLQQAMLAAMGYLPEALPAGVAGPGPGKRKGAPLSTAAQVPHCLAKPQVNWAFGCLAAAWTAQLGGSCCTSCLPKAP
jgi:hypothetical protein